MRNYVWVVMVLLVLAQSAAADEQDRVRFTGFGTLGVVYNDNDGADFRTRLGESEGAGLTNRYDTEVDSLFALQMDADIAEKLTGTAQFVSKKQSDGTAEPAAEWANLKYQVNSDFYVRVGRIVAPAFMVSDSRSIGYAQTPLRLPTNVYLPNSITNLNGADLGYKFSFDDVLYRICYAQGVLHQKLYDERVGISKVDWDIQILNLVIESGRSSYRISYSQSDLDIQNDVFTLYDSTLEKLVQAGVPGAKSIQEDVHFNDTFKPKFYALGYVFDDDRWMLQSELVERIIPGNGVQDAIGGYVMGGYRLDTWMPYVSASKVVSAEHYDVPNIDLATVPEELRDASKLIIAINKDAEDDDPFTTIYAVGARWDMAENIALKMQMELIDKPVGGSGDVFVNATQAFMDSHQKANVYSVAIDYIF